MIRRALILCRVVFCIILAGCGGNAVTKSMALQDAETYTHEGLRAFSEAQWNRARWLFTEALTRYQGMDNQLGVLNSHINMAELALSVEDFRKVQTHLDQAAYLAKNPELRKFQRRIILLYSLNALKQKQTALANRILQPLLPEFDGATPMGMPDMIQMVAIANRTKIAFVLKQDEPLWTLRYANALSISAIKSPDLTARLLRFQAELLQRQENYAESESKLLAALANYKNYLSRSGIAMTLLELGQLCVIQGRWEDAKGYFNRSIAVFRYLNDSEKISQVSESLMKLELKLGNIERSNISN